MMKTFESDSLPPTWKLLFVVTPGTYASIDYSRSSNNPRPYTKLYSDIKIAQYGAEDFYDYDHEQKTRQAKKYDLIVASAEMIPAIGLWEKIGDILISREPEIYLEQSYDDYKEKWRAKTISAVMLHTGEHCNSRESSVAAFAFADQTARYIPVNGVGDQSPEYLELIEKDRDARERKGLSPPPDYAALIFEHMAEQERLAARGE